MRKIHNLNLQNWSGKYEIDRKFFIYKLACVTNCYKSLQIRNFQMFIFNTNRVDVGIKVVGSKEKSPLSVNID